MIQIRQGKRLPHRVILVNVLVLVLVAACVRRSEPGAAPVDCAATGIARPTPVGPVVWVGMVAPSGQLAAAAWTGRLAQDHGCLVLENGVTRHLLALAQSGVSWHAQGQAVRIGARAIPLGQTVQLGGGEVRAGTEINWLSTPPRDCLQYPILVGAILPPRQ